MARFKNHLLVVVGFAVAGMIGAAFGTGTAQAVVSTLVTVVNPGTSPVHTSSVDDPGRIAYQSSVFNTGKCSGISCTFAFPSVPAGHRVVVQHISGDVSFTSIPGSVFVQIITNGTIAGFFAPVSTEATFALFDQPVLFYVDSSTPAAQVQVGSNATFGASFQLVTLFGYELDCTVAACAPIATQ